MGHVADLVHQIAFALGLPLTRVLDTRTGRGVCGHADVSRYYPASMGHTDPGPAFPWVRILEAPPAPPAATNLVGMEFIYRNPKNGGVYYTNGTHQVHLSKIQWDLYVFSAAIAGSHIPDLGNLSPEQLDAVARIPLVGAL